MPMTHHIGFEISEHVFRIVELRSGNRTTTILQADQFETEYNYSSNLLHEASINKTLAKSFIRDVTLFLRRQKLFASHISLTCASHIPFISTIPLDLHVSDEERIDQLRWECQLLAPFTTPCDVNVSTIPLHRNGNTEHVLAIALPTQTIDFLTSVFSMFSLNVTVLDVDHFAVEHAIQHIDHPSTFAVVGLHEKYATISMIERDRYIGFRMHRFASDGMQYSGILRLLHEMLIQAAHKQLPPVFLYGASCSDAVLYSLRSLLDVSIMRFEPLNHFLFAEESARTQTALALPPSTFAAALGAALRTDT